MLATACELLQRRRKELGMPYEVLARRSGVSIATLKRMLTAKVDNATFGTVEAVAKALSVRLELTPIEPSFTVRERQARDAAQLLVNLVQGSSGLEAQAVPERERQEMVEQTVHDLMAGAGSRIWNVA